MDRKTVEALCDRTGQALLATLPRPYDPAATVRLTSALRARGHSPELVAAALTQSELRTRAERKFGAAAHDLLFTRDGLEQSSRAAVAELHARLFAEAGVRAVHDLGCGIGADARAFAQAGLYVEAVESDPVTAAVAAFNLAAGPGQARVHHGQAEDPRWPRGAAARPARSAVGGASTGVWLDPGRRAPGVADATGRTHRIRSMELLSPSWETVQALAQQWPAAGVKMGAGFDRSRLPRGVEAQWVSHDGEVVECVLWWGALARDAGTSSAVVHSGGRWHRLGGPPVTTSPSPMRSPREIGPVVYELDPAVAAAGLRTQVGLELQARPLGSAAYLAGDRVAATPWARAWSVREVLPLRAAALRQWARREDVGSLTVKRPSRHAARGKTLPTVEEVRRRVAPRGSQPATVLLTDLGPDEPGVALWVSPGRSDEPAGR